MKKNEKGFGLIEVVIALLLLGIIGVALLSGLATASKALVIADERATAESLARSQMEYVKNQPYAASYSAPIPQDYVDAGYSVPPIDVDVIKGGLQKITITIEHQGKQVITLEGYKANR